MSYQSTLEDLAAKRRALEEVIVALAGVAGLDPAPFLSGSLADRKRMDDAPVARVKKGTKRAPRPQPARENDTHASILAALKSGPVSPGELAEKVSMSVANLRYWLKGLESDGKIVTTGVTAGRRIALP